MKKIILIAFVLIWILSLSLQVIALTDLIPNNMFTEYRFMISIGFISITGLIKITYSKLVSGKK